MEVKVDFFEDKPLVVKVPDKGSYKVLETAPPSGKAGDSPSFKNAELEGGGEVAVPDFIKVGDMVQVNINTLVYHSRVNV